MVIKYHFSFVFLRFFFFPFFICHCYYMIIILRAVIKVLLELMIIRVLTCVERINRIFYGLAEDKRNEKCSSE